MLFRSAIFGENKVKAIELCLNRFDVDTKNAFLELYKKVDETVEPAPAAEPVGATGSDYIDAFKEMIA